MTMLRILPNRYIALLLTPREASMLEGQILDPGDFPWQDSETEVVALGVKAQLHAAVAEMVAQELDASISAITRIAAATEERRREPAPPSEDENQLTITTQEETNG